MPSLSFTLGVSKDFALIRKTIAHLRAQTIADQIEMIILTADVSNLNLEEMALNGFHSYQVIRVNSFSSIAHVNAIGIRLATASVIALGEDHSFPEPDWAEHLLARHQGNYAAVGPQVVNGNPGSLISWADFLIGYGLWMNISAEGEIDLLPGHNSSYKREILLSYGDQLQRMLESESVLHWDLRARGHKLYLEVKARTHHMNFSLLKSFLAASFYNGRVFAAHRAAYWSPIKRIAFVGGSVLIPLVRLNRLLGQLHASDEWNRLFPRILPSLMAGLAISALGEMFGYGLGVGDAKERLPQFEFSRVHHVRQQDTWT
jgi:hypothetical protein